MLFSSTWMQALIKTRSPFSHIYVSLWGKKLSILMVWSIFAAVEPPVGNHPKCKDLVVAFERWWLTRLNPGGSLLGRAPSSDEQSIQLFDSNVGHTLAVLVYAAHTLFKFKMLLSFINASHFYLKSCSECWVQLINWNFKPTSCYLIIDNQKLLTR